LNLCIAISAELSTKTHLIKEKKQLRGERVQRQLGGGVTGGSQRRRQVESDVNGAAKGTLFGHAVNG